MVETTTERYVRVEEATELRDRRANAQEKKDEMDEEIETAYLSAYAEKVGYWIDQLESVEGLLEEEVRDKRSHALSDGREVDEWTAENIEIDARKDAAEHALKTYFGGVGNEFVELGELVSSSEFDGGVIELSCQNRTAELKASNETRAKATANLFLNQAGTSIDELRSGVVTDSL